MHVKKANPLIDKRLLRLARSSRAGIILTISLGLAGGALTVFQAWLLSRAVNSVFLAEKALGAIRGLMGMLLSVIISFVYLRTVRSQEEAASV